MKTKIGDGGRGVLVCMFLLFGTVLLQAQHILTLDDCLAIAHKNSLALRISATTIRSTQSAQDELKTTALPHLKFGAGAMYAPSSKGDRLS